MGLDSFGHSRRNYTTRSNRRAIIARSHWNTRNGTMKMCRCHNKTIRLTVAFMF
jgi:hypothetical protein